MRRALAALSMLFLVVVFAGAWQWPVESPSVWMGFGQTWSGTYSRGVALAGETGEVFPVAEGTVVYARPDESGSPHQLGVVVVVEHDRGFRSFYGHLEAGSTPEPGTRVNESTRIGQVGQTGVVGRPTLFLSILDTEAGAYVNPMLLLPALEDGVPPAVLSLFAQNDSALYDLSEETNLVPGEYLLVVECEDRVSTGGGSVIPYSLAVVVDGREQLALTHDHILFNDGYARINPGPTLPHDQVRTGDGGFIAGWVTVQTGRTLIEVIVDDFEGSRGSLVIEVRGQP